MKNAASLDNKAQALSELAVFGSILLIVLGVLINYALRYNYQQMVEQKVFSEAMASADRANQNFTPSSVQHVLIKDIRIPDPSNPFAIGAITTVGASAGVSRSHSDNFPETYSELPILSIEINNQVYNFTTANLTHVYNLPLLAKMKYLFIYGAGNVHQTDMATDESSAAGRRGCYWGTPASDPIYMHEICSNGPTTYNLTILDDCDGQIMNYHSAMARCRMITDSAVCINKCRETSFVTDSNENCQDICGFIIPIPWYCKNNALARLFQMSSPQGEPVDMGVQPGTQDEDKIAHTMQKTESASSTTTTDSINWQSNKQRKIAAKGWDGQLYNYTDAGLTEEKKGVTWSTPK